MYKENEFIQQSFLVIIIKLIFFSITNKHMVRPITITKPSPNFREKERQTDKDKKKSDEISEKAMQLW